ncbi:TonB-dependent receptor [Aequorivita echinoideorum]|uniref:TonB-dependent receptor n=1 Tax=Aequorivita echinoideorum TaxID=1549647 RepID=A0ABS5S4Q3_9FLAO|nr:TonB-dependent receptor [Aequorivita echinoideorum]MBT0607395.1 TonB-dependent receptor [Aequorivita echinoideorum]
MPKIATSYKKLIFISIFIVLGIKSFGQKIEETTLLSYITYVEKKFSVRFSYVTEEVEKIRIKPLSEEKETVENILSHLQSNTPLRYHRINERYISIALPNDENHLCVQLKDFETQLPLEGATILLGDGPYRTTSNAEGFFFIPAQHINSLYSISFVGYRTIEGNTSDLSRECTIILLRTSVFELDAVVVKNIFTNGINKNLDGSIRIVTENFGLLPGQVEDDILQITQALPGITSVDETISNINIRGGTHDETLMLWDDIKMYQTGHFFGLISAVNPDITKNVTVHKNGTNIRYGEGVSGVISMKPNNKIPNETQAGIGANLMNINAFLEMPISKKLGLQIAARKSINEFFESPIYRNYTSRIFQDSEISDIEDSESNIQITTDEDFGFYDISTKMLWKISEKDLIEFSALTIDNSLDFTETVSVNSQSKTSKLDQRSILGGLSWQHTLNDNAELTASTYSTYYLLDAIKKDIFTAQEQIQKNEVLETGIKLESNVGFSESWILQGGYHFSEIGIANTQDVNLPRFRDYEKKVLRTHALFAGLDYVAPNKKTFLFSGARINYFSKFEKYRVEPRLTINQKVGYGFAVEIMGEFKSQATTQRIDFDSDFLGIEKRRWVLADGEEIPILTSKQISLGLIYNKRDLFLNLEGFYKRVDNINSANQGLQNQYQFTKAIGNYSVRGIECTLNKKTGALSTWISYTYSNNQYNFETLEPKIFPNNLDVQHAATLAGTYVYKSLKIALGVNWHSGKPYTIPLENTETEIVGGIPIIKYDSPHQQRLPHYFRTDLSAEYNWKFSSRTSGKLNLALLNILNRENILNIRYSVARNENNVTTVNKIEEISLGITPNVSFQVFF